MRPPADNSSQSIVAFQFLFGSHPAHTALIEPSGEIIAVNETWDRFARDNGMPADYRFEGQNYLAMCERAVEDNAPDALEMLSGLLAVTTRRLPRFTWVYPCHSPTEKRWFRLWAAGHEGRSGVIVAHRYLGSTPPVHRARSYREVLGSDSQMFA